MLFKNNGFAFRSEDWDRLVKIAEGNPDEQKIGAFGVGFYSLFSVSENPFVSSGGQGMAFYWRGNQLFTKQGPIDDDDDDEGWTTFLMDTREPHDIPNIEEFTRFLVNSLGFTENLQEISLYIDDTLIAQLSKKMQEPTLIDIASGLNTFSPKNMFHLKSVDFRGVQLDVRRLFIPVKVDVKQLRSNIYQTEKASIMFRIASGNLDVKINKEFSAKMERIIKKKPPNNTSIKMIFTEFDELDSSVDYNKKLSPIFKDLISYPDQGKIYVGFSTNQTTGSCSHLGARVIPTMERELIDFAEPTLAEYNNEMLCLAGTLSRILYEYEMTQMSHFYNEIIGSDIDDNEETKLSDKSTPKQKTRKSLFEWFKKRILHLILKKRAQVVRMTQDDVEKTFPYREWLEKWAAHVIAHFTYNSSTPNMQVSTIAETQFSSCLKQNILIFSTQGLLPISDVRLPNPEIAEFIKSIPLVPKFMLEKCGTFFKKAKDANLIFELGFQDILNELKSRTLSDDEIIKLLKWWIKGNKFDAELLRFARIGDSSQTLSVIHFYLNPDKIPLDIDIPFGVLPYNISRNFTEQELRTWLLLNELPLVEWAKFIVKKPELESDFEFAEKVHHILAKNLDNISQQDKETIRQLFVKKKCIPTEFGMMFPNKTYFESFDLFPDLPTISFQNFTPKIRQLMEHLDVRTVVELKLITERLVNHKDCNYIQIIKYLASTFDYLKDAEMNSLRYKPIWPEENLLGSDEVRRFSIRDLHIPSRINRELGLPVIDWKGAWSNDSNEGKFLIKLGLQKYPKLETILNLSAPPTDPKIRKMAFNYFNDNFYKSYNDDYKPETINIAFLPCKSNTYARPSECFINDRCMLMGFEIVHEDLRSKVGKFNVRHDPSHEKLVKRLTENPPQDKNKAKEIFEYLNSQKKDFDNADWVILNNSKFIPIHDQLFKPSDCFFKLKEESLNEFFLSVDFGTQANKFLAKCGVKDEPSSEDFVQLLIDSSHELWNLYRDDIKKYLNILEKINDDVDKITLGKMEELDVLIAIKHDLNSKEDNIYYLSSAKEIYINDDKAYQQIFEPLIAPKKLEPLYKKLGCKSLHKSVTKSVVPNGPIQKTQYSRQLQKVIRERASLFYLNHYLKEVVRNDEKWLKKLKVREIEYMETSYKLESISKNERNNITTNIFQESTNSWTLYVTPNSNLIDISQHLVNSIFTSYNSKDISYFNTVLSTPLSSLKSIGIFETKIPILSLPFLNNDQKSDDIDDINMTDSFENEKQAIITSETTRDLRNLLQDSIKSRYSSSGSNKNSSIKCTTKTCINEINESQVNYCDIMPGYSIHCVGDLQKIELYVPNHVDQSEILSQSRAVPLSQFINMLKDLADIFEVTTKAIRIFYDNSVNSIAFNRDGALFFNFKFYLGLHEQECKTLPTTDAMTYWFMIFCHVLAHNFVQLHNSEFEYYSSSFAKTYMPNFLELMNKRKIPLKIFSTSAFWKKFNRFLAR
ncbi:hypothetical protein RclHR1_00010063 [Rhizophagus clarus]|nr:hypothetical protein RclHR1_00010063 [Rhizophagus clarus]